MPSSRVAEDASIFLKGKVKGIIYTGETDGDCAAIYDAGTVIPLGWRRTYESDWKSFGEGLKSFIGRGMTGNFKEGVYDDAYTPELNPRFFHFLETLSSEDLKDPRLSVRIKPFIERVARENPYDFLRRFAERDWAAPYIIGAAKSCSQKELETLLENFEENDLAKPYMHAVIKVFVEKSLYSLLLLFSKKEWANKPVESLKGKTWVEFVAKTLAEEDPIYFFENFSGEAWAKDYLSVARYALPEKDPRYFFENFSGEAWAKDYLSVARESLAKKDPYYLLVNFYEIEDWADSYITEEFLNRALNDRFYVENFLDNHAKESWTQKKLERLGRKSILDIAIQTYDKFNGLSEFLENYSKRVWAKPYLDIAAKDLSKNSPLIFLKTYSEMEWAKSYVTEEVIMRAFKEEDDLMEFIYSFSERDWAKKPVESLEGKTWIEFAEGKLSEKKLEEQKNASQNPINTKLIKLANALRYLNFENESLQIYHLKKISSEDGTPDVEIPATEQISVEIPATEQISNNASIAEISGKFKLNKLNDSQKKLLYEVFKSSYKESTGKAWTEDLFLSRADNWTFYGKIGEKNTGVVAIREQLGGLNKLVAIAGSPRSVLSGIHLLKEDKIDSPIWGAVSKDMTDIVKRYGFEIATSEELNKIKESLPNYMKRQIGEVNPKDGSFKMNIAEVGETTKYYIYNDKYKDLFQSTLPR
jgi:hypothetical protein